MTISMLKAEIVDTAEKYPFIKAIHLLDETDNALKMRLEIDDLTFIQIYHNLSSGTINYLLVHNFMRFYARDCCGGKWHRHPIENPASHDFSSAGSKPVSCLEFLKEVEEFLINENLI